MLYVKPSSVGLMFGVLLAGIHTLWSFLVFLGWAQPLLSFSLMMHMVSVPLTVLTFDGIRAVELVVLAFFIGYIGGTVVAHFANMFVRKELTVQAK